MKRLTSNSSGLLTLRDFGLNLVLVFTAQWFGLGVLRYQPLNWALCTYQGNYKLDKNVEYASHMISWLDKLGIPKLDIAEKSFKNVKSYWLQNESTDLEALREELWIWVDGHDGYNTQIADVAKMRIILCLAYEDNRELAEVGYFEDLLVSIGVSYEDAYKRT